MAKEEYIQVGVTALRDPVTGDFLPSVPLYIKATDEAERSAQGLVEDLGRLFAARFKQYLDGVPSMADSMVSDALKETAASGG